MRDQDTGIFCLNQEFSTTRMVTRELPVIVNKPEDTFETVLFLPEGEKRMGQGGLRTQGLFKQSLPDKPLITVITVVLNGAKHLEETILSVLNQTYDNVEYIIVDGGSTDGTLDIIRKYENAVDYWVSERDEGIYDAMNKGITLTTGILVAILNADDIYYQNTINDVASIFQCYQHHDFIYGSINMVDKNGNIFGCRIPHSEERILNFLHREIPFNHSSCFITHSTYRIIGLYDIFYTISSDYDLFFRIFKKKLRGKRINLIVGEFRTDGKSSGIHTFIENHKILLRNNYSITTAHYTFISSLLKYYIKFILPTKSIIFIKKFFKNTTHIYGKHN